MSTLSCFQPGLGLHSLPAPRLRERRWPWQRPSPTFLIIGAQKAGTSWLHRVLQPHPRVFTTERKELHFFSNPEVYAKGLPWYLEHFADARWSDRALGESTPNYLWASDHRIAEWGDGRAAGPAFRLGTPARIRHHLGEDLRLIVLLREPTQRAVSAFYHHLNAGGRLDPDLPFAVNARRLGIVQMGFYAAHLEQWLSEFPADRFLVLIQEEVRAHPRDALRACQRHIGVRPQVPDNLRDEVHTGTKHGGDGIWYWDRDQQRVAIGPAEIAFLREVYGPENERLAALLGRHPWPDRRSVPSTDRPL